MGKEIFDNIPSRVENLLMDVQNGKIGLPDLQRPFVWKDIKVRNLLDSMMKGYPIGYIMLWDSPSEYSNLSHIGQNKKMYSFPEDLVIDGQQRLTALLAAMHGVPIKDKKYQIRRIRISFNPLNRDFAVWTVASDKDPEWISEISEIFAADRDHNMRKFRQAYIDRVNESRKKNNRAELTDDEEEKIDSNINDLLDLKYYALPTLKINGKASEEDVAEIFVRVNSGGQNLRENNFIETLLAVYDNDVHHTINQFCEDSRIPKDGTAYNQILEVNPSHLIRIAVATGFKRARLRYAYMLLRGKDLQTGVVTLEEREANLAKFKESLAIATNLTNWHTFMNLFADAGYLNKDLVSADYAVIFSYVLYLIGRQDYKVRPEALKRIMCKWIFMATITGYYSGSTESNLEKQFADLNNIHTADEFVSYLDTIIKNHFTDDYFNLTLPSEMNTSSVQSRYWYGYLAALNVLGTPMLFSTTPQSHYFQPGTNSNKKKSLEVHHIFPKNYLSQLGYTNDRDRNQIANYTYLDYNTNIDISDKPPAEYAQTYRDKLGEEAYCRTCSQNAIPTNFGNLSYPDFIKERRNLMAQIIKKAYERLSNQ